MAVIIDGKALAKKIRANLKIKCDELKQGGIDPKLAVIMVGDNPASKVYVRNKSKACEEVGVKYEEYLLNENTTQEELISPIPAHLNINEAFKTITYIKDVDGFTPASIGKLCIGEDTFVSCTPNGVMKMFEEYNIDLSGKHVVILGRSNIVGKPLIQCCLQKNATVTTCHSRTKNLSDMTRQADIIISAIGQPEFLKADMVKNGVVIIDVGINRNDKGKLVGDVDFENVQKKASYITPVPGGVGPMTIAMLMSNVIKATEEQKKEKSNL